MLRDLFLRRLKNGFTLKNNNKVFRYFLNLHSEFCSSSSNRFKSIVFLSSDNFQACSVSVAPLLTVKPSSSKIKPLENRGGITKSSANKIHVNGMKNKN